MSQPHSSQDLQFRKHPTKTSTYIPARNKSHDILAWLAVLLGFAILCYAIFLITAGS